jgi:hypothetical protein
MNGTPFTMTRTWGQFGTLHLMRLLPCTQHNQSHSWLIFIVLAAIWVCPQVYAQVPASSPTYLYLGPGSHTSTASDNRTMPHPVGLAWSDLGALQQKALAPLAPPKWSHLSHLQQQKWVALTRNYANLSPTQQAQIQAQMRTWADLTPEQRRLARHYFAQVRSISAQNKQRSWQAYQGLSSEEKQHLTSVVPVDSNRWSTTSIAKCQASNCHMPHPSLIKPRINAHPSQVHPKTLLPHHQKSISRLPASASSARTASTPASGMTASSFASQRTGYPVVWPARLILQSHSTQ